MTMTKPLPSSTVVFLILACCLSMDVTVGTTTVDYCVMAGCVNSFVGCYDKVDPVAIVCNDTYDPPNYSANMTCSETLQLALQNVTTTTWCDCTGGFTGRFCEIDMLLYVKDNTTSGTYTDMETVNAKCRLALLGLEDHVSIGYASLSQSLSNIAEIQTNLMNQVRSFQDASTPMSVFQNNMLQMSYQIMKLTPGLLCANCSLTVAEAKTLVMDAEANVLEFVKLLLSIIDVTHGKPHVGVIPYTGFSVAYTKAKGPSLPFRYKTTLGAFDLPYWETFHDMIKTKTVSVILLTYETSPYLFAANSDDISTGLVKTIVIDKYGNDLNLEDPDDPIALDADATQSITPSQGWLPLDRLSSPTGAFLAVAAFNFTVNAVILDLRLDTMKSCSTYGLFKRSIPTETEYEIKVETKGKSRIKSVYPEEFSASFSDHILQLALNYKGDESMDKPFLATVICEDDKLLSDDHGHEYRLSLVDLRYFNPIHAQWEKTQNVELASGKASTVAFKSKMFGTFSADMMLISPDTIDFTAVFLNFLERLQSNPYALIVILSLWCIFILIAVFLRRIDIRDEALWTYLPLLDNNPWGKAAYYMTISTGLRSSRHLTSTPFFNLVGSDGETGARVLTDGRRKVGIITEAFSQNFQRGTTSHFYVTAPKHLGELKHMTIWHDNEGKSPNWLLSKIVIHDPSTNDRHVFLCGEWMALDRGDEKLWKRVLAQNEKLIGSQMLFSELSLRQMFDDNLWFSISARPHFSQFNRVQRLWTISALLFLSMIVSAMFYNTPAGKENSIALGPFTFSYKQVYVGFIAAALAVVPTFVIMTIFRNRNKRIEDTEEDYTEDTHGKEDAKCSCPRPSLPWWTIYIAYGLVGAAILSSSTFTFLYSLDWGEDITLQWLLSFFVGTVQSIVVIEPLKAMVLAAILSFCFSGGAQKLVASVPIPPKMEATEAVDLPLEKQWCPTNIPSPGDIQEVAEIDQHGHRLKLDRMLSNKLVTWTLNIGYAVLLLALCSQNAITTAYHQNHNLKSALQPKAQIMEVEDIWTWFTDVFVVNVFPKFAYNGRIRESYRQRFFYDEYLFRMGLVRIRQVRTSETCEPYHMLGDIKCPGDYSVISEEAGEFCKGWHPFNESCFDENEELDYSFKYYTSEDTQAFPYFGEHALYGSGGYYIDIGPKQSAAFRSVEELRDNVWIDDKTRAVFVTFLAFNANTNLFSYVKVVFEFPPFGGITVKLETISANLYPYSTAWDYVVLFAQFVFIFVIILRLVLLVKDAVVTRGRLFKTLWFYFIFGDILLCVAAIICYVIRLDGTVTAIEKIGKNPRQYVSFQQASTMDSLFMAFIGFACFIAILHLLTPLTFNYHFHVFRVFFVTSKHQLAGLFLTQGLILVAFTFLVYGFYSTSHWALRNLLSTLMFLYRIALGMFKVTRSIEFLDTDNVVIFSLFGFAVCLVLINLCVSILNEGYARAQILSKRSGKYAFNSELNEFFWWKMANFLGIFKCCGEKSSTKDKYALAEDATDRLQQINTMKSFENFVFHMALDEVNNEQQIFKTCFDWQGTPTDRSRLQCDCTTNVDETNFKYYDQKERFIMSIVFPMEIPDDDVTVSGIDISKAKSRRIYPCDKSTTPLSKMFKVTAPTSLRKKSSVTVMIVDMKPMTEPEIPAFVVSSYDNGKTWETTASSSSSRVLTGECPCVVTELRACPTHVMAISCELWPDVSEAMMDRLEMHTVPRKGCSIRLRCNDGIIITAERGTVDTDTDLCVLVEDWSPAPMVTIVCTEDISRPLRLVMPLNMLERGERADGLIILVKDGDLRWQKALCAPQKIRTSICYVINSLNRRVATKIMVKRSEIAKNLTSSTIPNDYLRASIRAVCMNSKISRRWRQLGKSLGVPVTFLDCVEGDLPRCSEEKCSIVLHEWCVNDPDACAEQLEERLSRLGIQPINKLANYM